MANKYYRRPEARTFAGKLPTVFQLGGTIRQVWSHQDLVKLLSASRACSCDKPSDKTYALFGLLDATEEYPLAVDYSRPYQDVYTALATWDIQQRHTLDIVQHVCTIQTPSRLSSWVPYWHERDNDSPVPQYSSLDNPISLIQPLDWTKFVELNSDHFSKLGDLSMLSLPNTLTTRAHKLGDVWNLKDLFDTGASIWPGAER